jgi:hypothetical protein
MALAKAEEGQDRQNHNDQADEIDKTVHGFLLMSAPFFNRQSAATGKVPHADRKKRQPVERDGRLMPSMSFDLIASVPIFGLCATPV